MKITADVSPTKCFNGVTSHIDELSATGIQSPHYCLPAGAAARPVIPAASSTTGGSDVSPIGTLGLTAK